MAPVEPHTILVYGDLACPWATCAVVRLHRTRERLGLVDEVDFDHRAFPLELVNEHPTPKNVLDSEIPVAGALEPDFGFRVWSEPDWTWPGSVLVALEAVQAAKEQSLRASANLDLALRRAFFRDHRPVSLLPEVLEVAAETEDLDAEALAKTLDAGGHRATVLDQWRAAEDFGVEASPHLFLADGSDYVNPGVELHWVEEPGTGFPIVDEDDSSIYEEILDRAARS
jgi:predicted DsbA family dithiol-disulfide isomerase